MRAAYGYDSDAASAACVLECKEPTLTQQASKEEADINTIVRRFGVTGRLPVVALPPLEGDFEGVFDFRQAQDLLIAARKSFMAIDADARERFGNDPARFVAFCSDPKNLDEMRKLGLAVPAKVDPTVAAAPAG